MQQHSVSRLPAWFLPSFCRRLAPPAARSRCLQGGPPPQQPPLTAPVSVLVPVPMQMSERVVPVVRLPLTHCLSTIH